MRAIYLSTAMNVAALALKAAAVATSGSAAVDAEFLHALGDLAGSSLIALGAYIAATRAPSMRFPFGLGRAVYALSLIASTLIAGFLAALAVVAGIDKLAASSPVTAGIAPAALLAASVLDAGVLYLGIRESSGGVFDPSTRWVLIENSMDLLGNAAALTSLALLTPVVAAYASFAIAALLAVSSSSLAYRSFLVLVGVSAPRNVVGRLIKVAASHPDVVDVDDVRTMVIEPGKYLAIMKVEFREGTTLDRIESAKREIAEAVRRVEPGIEFLIIEAIPPEGEATTFLELLSRLRGLS